MNLISKIGVFDSGLGGLTVLNEICKHNTGLEIIYFGDTARVPYGSRTPETIARYAEQDVRFLLSKGVEAIVIACGTVSATCLGILNTRYKIPIVGVIEAASSEAVKVTKTKHVAVIGTKATIKSNAYSELIHSADPNVKVTGIACPLLVPLIENGFTPNDPIVRMTLERYLDSIQKTDIDTLVLGCTHYPYLQNVIQDMLPSMKLINIGTALATNLRNKFNLKNGQSGNNVQYYVSDEDTEFQKIANSYLDSIQANNVQKINIELF